MLLNLKQESSPLPLSVSPPVDTVASPEDGVDDPGAARFGNFPNYYRFNPPENRLRLIPHTLLQELQPQPPGPTLILDVGCNSGELSVALYRHLVFPSGTSAPPGQAQPPVHLLGLDLDPVLVDRAQRLNPFPERLRFLCADVLEDTAPLLAYVSAHSGGGSGSSSSSSFHLGLCLAVSMWVHLNHGDAGLLLLLRRLASLCQHLLLEAQPWSCYRAAARRQRRAGGAPFRPLAALQLRGDVSAHACDFLLSQCGMELVRTYGKTAWGRELLLLRRRSSSSRGGEEERPEELTGSTGEPRGEVKV